MIEDGQIFAEADNKAKLIRMAGEIAGFFHAYPEDKAVAAIADHINKFWTPRMREDFLAAADEPGVTLPPLLQAARARIRRKRVK